MSNVKIWGFCQNKDMIWRRSFHSDKLETNRRDIGSVIGRMIFDEKVLTPMEVDDDLSDQPQEPMIVKDVGLDLWENKNIHTGIIEDGIKIGHVQLTRNEWYHDTKIDTLNKQRALFEKLSRGFNLVKSVDHPKMANNEEFIACVH